MRVSAPNSPQTDFVAAAGDMAEVGSK